MKKLLKLKNLFIINIIINIVLVVIFFAFFANLLFFLPIAKGVTKFVTWGGYGLWLKLKSSNIPQKESSALNKLLSKFSINSSS